MGTLDYLFKWCPFEDELLVHATWLDYEERLQKNFHSVEYFVHTFPNALDKMNMDMLNEEYVDYQLLSVEDLTSSLRYQDNPHRVDYLWVYLRGVKEHGTNVFAFGQLFRVAEVVMTIPHSNDGEERIFSLINKSKTLTRSSLQIDGTLSSPIIIDNPLKWEPSEAVLEEVISMQSASYYLPMCIEQTINIYIIFCYLLL